MTPTSNNKASSSGSGNEASLSATEALAEEMAAALALTFPRIRISQLEPVQAVARGYKALADQRVQAAQKEANSKGFFSYLDEEELRIRVLAECLATWQAESMEAKLDQWLSSCDAGFRKISISNPSGKAYDAFLVHVHPGGTGQREWYGHGETPGIALGKALEAFDEEGGDA